MARKRKENGEGEQQQAPGVGHNLEAMTDDQIAALTFQHKRKYHEALGAKKLADAAFKNVCKIAKAELGDDAVSNIKDMIALETEEGEILHKTEMARKAKVARWMGLPLGAEPDMFGEDRTPAVDRAFAAGKKIGLAGEPCQPPHDPSTAQYTKWMEGFHEGQAVLAKGIKPKDDSLAGMSAGIAAETAARDEAALTH